MCNIRFVFILELLMLFSMMQAVAQVSYLNHLELNDTSKIDLPRWVKEGTALKVAFGSIDESYRRNCVPEKNLSSQVKLTAWKGERVNLQIVLWSSQNLKNITITPKDLVFKKNEISRELINVYPIRYVLTDLFLNGCGYRKNDTIPFSLAPDMLDNDDTFSITGKSTRPVWISINVPADAKSGVYNGVIEIKAKRRFKRRLHYTLDVQNWELPKPADWRFHLDLWQHPWAISRTEKAKPWTEEHFDALRQNLTMLAEAGQKCITTTIINDPWHGQTFDPYESMIQWRKTTDGGWVYDFTLFDQWVEFAMSCGIKEQINCYSMIPWSNAFQYLDEESNSLKVLKANPGSEAFNNHWRPFLLAFREHLQNKGWLNKTCIAMDERNINDMLSMINLIKETTPELKIAFAGSFHPELVNEVYDLCTFIDPVIDSVSLTQRLKKQWPSTFYVCCSKPQHPNNFTFSPTAENTLMGWYAAATGYNGFLRWAFNSWGKDPERDSRFITWPAGDTYLVYPGARSSIRFERLREGIQDFEKIRILRETLQKENSEAANVKLSQLSSQLKTFTLTSVTADSAAVLVNDAKNLLNKLSK